MWNLRPSALTLDEPRLTVSWQAATPFPYLVFDDFVDAAALPELFAILDEEPVDDYHGDIFEFEASTPEPRTDALRALRASFGAALSPSLTRVTGKSVVRADMRAYAYRMGHYLLPHTDHQEAVGRSLAYAYYLPSPEPPVGGELELFTCVLENGVATSIQTARLIEPKANRLVVFDVNDASLHQVREVLSGLRVSLAGWFYP